MEAMARGLAVLATPVGAVESIVDEANGWLIEPGDSRVIVQSLNNISEMDRGSLLLKQLNSLNKIKLLTWDSIARETTSRISDRCVALGKGTLS
jgi:glycosyltransferase involved in cell wall biosynthesis